MFESRLGSMMLKEIIQFSRDHVILLVILWMYTLEVVLCGYGMTFEVKNLPIAVVDLDKSPASRLLTEKFALSESFKIAGYPNSQDEAAQWMRKAKATIVMVLPKGFERGLHRGDPDAIQFIIDGTNANTAQIAKDYSHKILELFQEEFFGLTKANATKPVVQIWYNRQQTLSSFMVLSMIAIAALMVGAIHPAASMVREKEVGTIEQLMVTPVGVTQMFLSKTVPTLVVGLLAIFPSLIIVWWFGVPLRGSLLLFLGLSSIFLISAISLGVLIAAVTKTLQQALLLTFFGIFPIMFLSGTMTPIEGMPQALQLFSYLSPLRYYNDITMGIFLKGTGMAELWPQTLAMLAIGLVLYAISAAVFRRNMA